MFTAEKRTALVGGEPVDIGLVGDVVHVNPDAVLDIVAAGRIPVVAGVAPDVDGTVLQHQRRFRGRGARRPRWTRRSSSCSPTSRASTPTSRTATR